MTTTPTIDDTDTLADMARDWRAKDAEATACRGEADALRDRERQAHQIVASVTLDTLAADAFVLALVRAQAALPVLRELIVEADRQASQAARAAEVARRRWQFAAEDAAQAA